MLIEDAPGVVAEAAHQRRQAAGQRVVNAQFVDPIAIGFYFGAVAKRAVIQDPAANDSAANAKTRNQVSFIDPDCIN